MIDVKDLRKSFVELEVLKGVSQHISKGERVVLIGPSGSGKSTFLRCLNLLETPTAGEIIFEGHFPDQRHRRKGTGVCRPWCCQPDVRGHVPIPWCRPDLPDSGHAVYLAAGNL